jgi:hypothetical protein
MAMIACLKKPATTISKIGNSAPRAGSRRKNQTNATIMMARAGTCGSFIATYQSAYRTMMPKKKRPPRMAPGQAALN